LSETSSIAQQQGPCGPGLRERKKRQTRDTIARAALRLFAERGYDSTTLAEIAEAAGVSPRTIFAYYESKEDILFSDALDVFDALKHTLAQRPAGTTTVGALRELLSTMEPPDEDDRLRKQILTAEPGLRARLRARDAQLEPVLAEAIAQDLGTAPDDIRALLVAASMTAAFSAVRDQFMQAAVGGDPLTHEQGLAILDEVLEFLRGGLDALRGLDARRTLPTRS
jgi:AcrR family transcriptional regulator